MLLSLPLLRCILLAATTVALLLVSVSRPPRCYYRCIAAGVGVASSSLLPPLHCCWCRCRVLLAATISRWCRSWWHCSAAAGCCWSRWCRSRWHCVVAPFPQLWSFRFILLLHKIPITLMNKNYTVRAFCSSVQDKSIGRCTKKTTACLLASSLDCCIFDLSCCSTIPITLNNNYTVRVYCGSA
jgi:hypothetical protein